VTALEWAVLKETVKAPIPFKPPLSAGAFPYWYRVLTEIDVFEAVL
jgi:hypothetical protein